MPFKYLTQAQLERLFSVICAPRNRALLGTIYHYGLRATEATLLRLSDVDFDHGTIYIYRLKGGISSLKPLLPATADLLSTYLPYREPKGDTFFTGTQGSLGRHQIRKIFKGYAQKVGLGEYSVHCLRHSIATHMREAGFELEDVKDHLGHQKIESTYIYAHITPRRLAKVFKRIEKSPSIVKVLSTERSID